MEDRLTLTDPYYYYKKYGCTAGTILFLYQDGINNIQPSQDAVDNGPQYGFVARPRNNHRYNGTQANTGPYIHRLLVNIAAVWPRSAGNKNECKANNGQVVFIFHDKLFRYLLHSYKIFAGGNCNIGLFVL
jgi:hypothetical protein